MYPLQNATIITQVLFRPSIEKKNRQGWKLTVASNEDCLTNPQWTKLANGKVRAGANNDEVVVVKPSAPIIAYCLGIHHGKWVKVHDARVLTVPGNPGK